MLKGDGTAGQVKAFRPGPNAWTVIRGSGNLRYEITLTWLGSRMRAVTFSVSVADYLLARSLGRYSTAATFGALSGVRLRDVPEPSIPGPDWVRLRVSFCGICGSDLSNVSYHSSPAMEPFGSFPAVLGHEILAVVEEVGPAVTRVERGQRVTVDPMLACTARGYADACPSCSDGLHSTCERAGESGPLQIDGRDLGPGLTMGYHRDLPGGWGEALIAHESQVFPVDDALEDRAAVLMEPLSIAVHAVLGTALPASGPILVIGSGPIAFATIWALRALGFEGTLVSQAKRANEAELARSLGATEVIKPGPEARDALIATGAQAYMPIMGPEVYAGGGFPLIFDCVGSQATIAQLLSYAAPRGRGVLLGCAGEIKKLDLTLVWARELDVRGFVGYGAETWRGERRHTFEVTHDLLIETGAEVAQMVTHVYPLSQYRDALRAADDRRKSGAVKVLLTPDG